MKFEINSFNQNEDNKHIPISEIEEETWNSEVTRNSFKVFFISTEQIQQPLGFNLFVTSIMVAPLLIGYFFGTSILGFILFIILSTVSSSFIAQSFIDIRMYKKLKAYLLSKNPNFDGLMSLKSNNTKRILFNSLLTLPFLMIYYMVGSLNMDYKLISYLILFFITTIIANAGGLFGMRAVLVVQNLPFLLSSIQKHIKSNK